MTKLIFFEGMPGSGKTTSGRFVKELLDKIIYHAYFIMKVMIVIQSMIILVFMAKKVINNLVTIVVNIKMKLKIQLFK